MSPLSPSLPLPAYLTTSPGVAPSGEELTLYPFCVWSCWNQRVQPDLWASLSSWLVCPHSLCSQERLVKQEPRHPAVTYPGGPWPVVHGVRAETNTGVCMTSSQPTYNNSREGHSRVSFWSGKRVWVGEKKRRRCLFLYFNLCLPKISFNDTHPSVWLQNLKVKSACTICVTILPSLPKSCPWIRPTPCFHLLLSSWCFKLRSPPHKYD